MNAASTAASSSTVDASAPRARFRGIVPPMITPLSDADTLDVASLERLLSHLLDGGVHGLFILGSCGEGPSLSVSVQRELVRRVSAAVAGRVPLIVGITNASFSESVALASHAADCGADAVMAAAPYYFPISQGQLARWAERLAASVPLPFFIYNMPAMVKISIEPETLQRLCQSPNIIGVKDSSGDIDLFSRLTAVARRERPEWSILVGPEQLLPKTYALGGDGAIPGGANLVPRLFVSMYEALRSNDGAGVEAAVARARRLEPLYDIGSTPGSFIVAMKAAAAWLGLCSETMASEFDPFDAKQRERVAAVLRDVGAKA